MSGDRERQFWIAMRQALLLVVAAIEARYQLETAVITREQRKELHRLAARKRVQSEGG